MKYQRTFRISLRAFSCAAVLISSILIGGSPASAGAERVDLEWDRRGQDCVDQRPYDDWAFVVTTAFAPDLDPSQENPWDPPIGAEASVSNSPPILELAVPNSFFGQERELTDGPISGFYMMGLKFVDDCTNLESIPFEPCITTTPDPDPWVIPLGDEFLLIFFFGDVTESPGTYEESTIFISRNLGSCVDDPEDNVPVGVDEEEAIDLVGELGLAFDAVPQFRAELDLDYLLERSTSGPKSLPITL